MPQVAYMWVTGEKQGKISGGSERTGREDSIEVDEIYHEVDHPWDPNTGRPHGHRKHQPLRVVAEIGRHSPLLYQALCHGENLPEVTIKMFRTSRQGQEEHFYTVQLTNARLAHVRNTMANARDPKVAMVPHYEEIGFTYEKIKWQFRDGNIEFVDNWYQPA